MHTEIKFALLNREIKEYFVNVILPIKMERMSSWRQVLYVGVECRLSKITTPFNCRISPSHNSQRRYFYILRISTISTPTNSSNELFSKTRFSSISGNNFYMHYFFFLLKQFSMHFFPQWTNNSNYSSEQENALAYNPKQTEVHFSTFSS